MRLHRLGFGLRSALILSLGVSLTGCAGIALSNFLLSALFPYQCAAAGGRLAAGGETCEIWDEERQEYYEITYDEAALYFDFEPIDESDVVVNVAQLAESQTALANAKAEMDQCAGRVNASAPAAAAQSQELQSLIEEGNQPFGNANTSASDAFANWQARVEQATSDAWDLGLECGVIAPGQGPDYPDPNSTFWSFFPTG